MTVTIKTRSAKDLTYAQRRALEGIHILTSPVTGGADLATLRANGNRADVIHRLCFYGLAYEAGNYGNREEAYFNLSEDGRRVLGEIEAARGE